LLKQGMVIVGRQDDPHGLEIDWRRYNVNNMPFTFQQLPSPRTALGYVVFDMPNPMDVYLHDTPDRRLFARGDRYFSHGCIRVENPRALALYLLKGNAAWDDKKFDEAIATGDTQRVPIAQPVPIFLLYATVVAGKDGAPEFRTDIYKRDQRLLLALEQRKSDPDANAVIYEDLMVKAPAQPVKTTTPITVPGASKTTAKTLGP
jgi:murein L,D-transpeptidase YcbB/YkuD